MPTLSLDDLIRCNPLIIDFISHVLSAIPLQYDRSAISQWLTTKDTSPMTNAKLPHKQLTPNHALRSSIMEWKENHPA